MESMPATIATQRETVLFDWLINVCGLSPDLMQPLVGDASFRRYFRLPHKNGTYIVMDAPPPEDCKTFTLIARALQTRGLNVPEILQADFNHGFLLLSDFGDATYLKSLRADNADALYNCALSSLAILQSCQYTQIPVFDFNFMWQEWILCKEWFLQKYLNLFAEENVDHDVAKLVTVAETQPQVFIHRDYHSANLMVLPQQTVGILDFQDASKGPVTYDLVSLMRDAYIDWPHDKVQQWVSHYLHTLEISVSLDEFMYWFDFMGMQRHLKVLMIFARKQLRDRDARYLIFLPRVLHYLLHVSQKYPELLTLYSFLQKKVKPALEEKKCGVP